MVIVLLVNDFPSASFIQEVGEGKHLLSYGYLPGYAYISNGYACVRTGTGKGNLGM